MPAAVTPQVWATPPVTAAKLTPAGACTSTGLDWLVVVPSPIWPPRLPSQQQAPPAAVSPQVWKPPAATAAKLTPAGACTSTGLDRFVIVPSPSWPLPLAPQQ